MKSVESAAFSFLVPAGSAYDPPQRAGLSNFTCEMMLRGAGPRDARQFINDLDNLGVEHGEGVSPVHASFGGATLADNLFPALDIFADLLRRPHLPANKLEASLQVVLQEVLAVEDDPSQKLMQQLRRRHFPDPFGRPSHGETQSLQAITVDDVSACYERLYRPNETIIGVAGRFEWEALKEKIGELFGDWKPKDVSGPTAGSPGERQMHIPFDSQQTQIGIAFPTAPYFHPNYFEAFAGVWILGGSGASARFFAEVREKRGLCYSVSATTKIITREIAGVLCYAGTSADRAQETLDVMFTELRRLPCGIEADELGYLKARVKTHLIMQQESSSSRSGGLAGDWYHLGRVRTLDELGAIIDGLSLDRINDYLTKHPPEDFTVVTLGPEALKVSGEARSE